ncbi:hypothetical protein Plec18167_003773 [Paecilomyces lecythidis]|uniref:Transcription initiation factor TFIID subunit 4 n=1 Tax=Paecilomyces lecythidis TaxID=3004212 RepID=A0ABR3XXY3_9EURO
MAQTQPPHQFPSQPFSPPVSTPSPGAASPVNGGAVPPPQKRQRLSPMPQSQSPYASPSFGTLHIPQNPSPMMNGTNMNGMTPTQMPSQAPPPVGTMGPPSRPVEKTTDAAELTDVIASSGIDMKEEEAFLTQEYAAPGAQAQQRPQPPPLNMSFTSQASTPGTMTPSASFTDLSQQKPPSAPDSFYAAEPAAPAPAPFKDPNEPTREDTQAARRSQYHLQDPFLLTKVLEQRLQKRGFELGVRIPAEGLFHPVPGRPQPIEVTGPDGSSIVRKGQTILNQEGAPLVDILTLMSLSCEERLRTVIDYSATLARSRRIHSHGTIPAEWKELAVPVGAGEENVAGTKATSLKRSHSESTDAVNPLTEKYRKFMEKDVSVEEIRAAKRAKRSASAILGDSSRAGSAEMPASGAATPTGEKAPPFDKKGLTKKEAKKQLDARASEAQQHQQSIETARMATNNMLSGNPFGRKKTYSWLNKGPSAGSGFSTPRTQPATPGAGGDKGSRSGDTGAATVSKRLGDWREDKEKGLGIQVRDVLFMLELDGRGTRHVQKAYSKDVKEDRLE